MTVLNYLKLASAGFEFNLFKKRKLIKVSHRITHRCNYRCSYCSLWKDRCRELTTGEVLNLIDEVADMGCVVYAISGGEPLVRKDLPEMLKRIKERGMMARIVTNGSLLYERIDEISSNVDLINISVDAINAAVDSESVKVLDEIVVEGIKAAVNRVKHVGINLVLAGQPAIEVEKVVRYATALGVHSFTFFPVINHFKYMAPEEIAEAYEREYGGIKNYRNAVLKFRELKKAGYHITMSDAMLQALYDFKVPKIKCISGYLSCGISPEGRLGTCYEFRRESTNPYRNGNFLELWMELGKDLDWVDKCKGCLLHCYFEPNAIFSFKLGSLISYGKRYINLF